MNLKMRKPTVKGIAIFWKVVVQLALTVVKLVTDHVTVINRVQLLAFFVGLLAMIEVLALKKFVIIVHVPGI